ncbi:MAG: DUF2845 domain-containing protein [Myxococcota bacterium]
MRLAGACLILLLLFASSLAQANRLRCGTSVISRGDPAIELRARCGEPSFVETRVEETSLLDPVQGIISTTAVQVKEWLITFEDGSLPRLVQIRDGLVDRVETLSRVVVPDEDRCRRGLGIGTSTAEVHLACGAPDAVDVSTVTNTILRKGLSYQQTGVVERWTYNFGSNRLLRYFRFENGRLVDKETGGYGF